MKIIAMINDKEVCLANTTCVPQINEIIILYNDTCENLYIVKSVQSYFLENKNYPQVFTCEKAVVTLEEIVK